MKRLTTARLMTACMFVIALLVLVSSARADMITFDGPGYVAGSAPPAPWTDPDTARGGSDPGVVYTVAAGAGSGGSQALAVNSNYSYFEPYAVYVLPEPLVQGTGPKRISVMFDPPQNDP